MTRKQDLLEAAAVALATGHSPFGTDFLVVHDVSDAEIKTLRNLLAQGAFLLHLKIGHVKNDSAKAQAAALDLFNAAEKAELAREEGAQ